MADSYLRSGQVANVEALMRRVFATRLAMAGGGTQVVFARFDSDTGDYVAVPPQTVIVEFYARKERVTSDEGAQVTNVDGTMTKPVPFDIAPGYVFTIDGPDGALSGEVVAVFPPVLGQQKAAFTLRTGGI